MEQKIITQCMREGLPLPKKIANAPELSLGLELYFDAFFELSSCRENGWSVGPIPWSVIKDYALTFDFDEEQFDDLYYFIRALDVEYLKFCAPKEKVKR